jgi:aryl-alcohol dehydrogenase-like predicted oxidoreductase
VGLLPWVLAPGEEIRRIPGTRRQSYLEEKAAAADIALTPGEKRELEAVLPIGAVAGERSSEGMMRLIDTQRP